ncbi:DUF4037 domain-containing protein [Halosimplex marinum]|uniref:DUF4037 domain-containing protein n=1 Tax=Halosimplex marinum TaxID=3396620 RepID=UPI003F55894F
MSGSEHERVAGDISERLRELESIRAVSLTGSTSGDGAEPPSDIDVAAFYAPDPPAPERCNSALDPVTDGFTGAVEWEHEISGTCRHYVRAGTEIDLLLIDLQELRAAIERLHASGVETPKWAPNDAAFGKYKSMHADSVRTCDILYEEAGVLTELKRLSSEYSEEFGEATASYHLDAAEDLLTRRIEPQAERGDFLHFHACSARCLRSLVLCLFALNRRYYPGDKWNYDYIEEFEVRPDGLESTLETLRTTDASDEAAMMRQVAALRRLLEETRALYRSEWPSGQNPSE